MIRRTTICLCIIVYAGLNLWAQEPDLMIRGDFIEVPFIDFTQEVKAQTGASFFFLADWIKDLNITAIGEWISLRSTLDASLPVAGLSYIIVDNDLIIIGGKSAFDSYIPDYSGLEAILTESHIYEDNTGLQIDYDSVFWDQETDLFFNGRFSDVSFIDFTNEVHQQTGASFYYLADWVKGLKVTAIGLGTSLRATLDRSIVPAGLNYVIVDEDQIYLGIRDPYFFHVPDYAGLLTDLNESGDYGAYDVVSGSQRKYIEGRKLRILDTLIVGTLIEGESLATAVIHGKLTDADTGEPLIGATVYFNELEKGAASDLDGRYNIVVKPGRYTVEYKCMGMEEKKYYMEVLSGGALSIALEKSVVSLTEVVVQANSYYNIQGTQMGVDRLNYKVLKDVPVAMGEKDVLRVVQMLPGVQSVGEGAAGFNVRGSAADQNMIYLNKIPVYNTSHLFGFFTSFNSDIVKDFTLYKSNLPVYYGGRLASVTNITTRQGNMNKFAARGGISPVTANLTLESPIKKDKSAILISGRSTYSDWILNQVEIPIFSRSKARFHDLAAALTWEPGEKTLIKAFAYTSQDQFALGYTNDYNYSNLGGSLNIRQRLGPRLNLNMAFIYSDYQFSTEERQVVSNAYTHDYQITHHEARADISWLSLGKHNFTFGANAIYYDLNRGNIEPYGDTSLIAPLDLGGEYGVEAAAYLADEISVFKWLTLYGGVRYVVYKYLGPDEVMIYGENLPFQSWNVRDTLYVAEGEVSSSYTSLEPRAAINILMGPNHSIKLSYNRVRQFIFMLSNTIAISPNDQWKLCDYHLKPPSAEQYSFGYYLNVPKGSVSASLEFYYKTTTDVLDYKDGASFISTPHTETLVVPGNQEAYGIEAMIRKGTGKLSGWLAYSYARSYMQVASSHPGESINEGRQFPSNYDRPHSLSFVSNIKLNRRISISSNLVYMTGRPVTYPIARFKIEDLQFLKYSDRNAYRIPNYFRLDVSLNLEGNLKRKKLFHSYWMLNFYNVTGRQNAYSVFFKTEGGVINGYKLSIFGQMLITLSWNFKLGNYATE